MSLICWSGGCDSTLALYQLARGSKEPVRALSIVHQQVPAASEGKRARKLLLERFRKLKIKVEHTTVTIKHHGRFAAEQFKLAQPLVWLTTAVSYLREDEDLALGYIKGDDFWRDASEFERAFDGLQAVGGRSGRLRFPVDWMTKADVIAFLRAAGLYSRCWWCEAPVIGHGKAMRPSELMEKECGRACGKCRSCASHLTARWQLSKGMAPATVPKAGWCGDVNERPDDEAKGRMDDEKDDSDAALPVDWKKNGVF